MEGWWDELPGWGKRKQSNFSKHRRIWSRVLCRSDALRGRNTPCKYVCISSNTLSKTSCDAPSEYSVSKFCQSRTRNWSRWKGFLKCADFVVSSSSWVSSELTLSRESFFSSTAAAISVLSSDSFFPSPSFTSPWLFSKAVSTAVFFNKLGFVFSAYKHDKKKKLISRLEGRGRILIRSLLSIIVRQEEADGLRWKIRHECPHSKVNECNDIILVYQISDILE